MARAYYNENDPFAAAWLRELIKGNLICPGYVDERSIEEVKLEDLSDYTQHHWFAGIGTWSYSLRCAGWSDDRPVWTGSCPCQPFSAAGKRKGFGDKRHLWPKWFRLIREYRPDTIFGEQVASKDALTWFDTVSADLENEGYAVGTLDTCAASVGAPHIRQRMYFVADSGSQSTGRRLQRSAKSLETSSIGTPDQSQRSSSFIGVAHPGSERRQQVGGSTSGHEETYGRTRRNGSESDSDNFIGSNRETSELADSHGGNSSTERLQRSREHGQQPKDGLVNRLAYSEREQKHQEQQKSHENEAERRSDGSSRCCVASTTGGFWAACDWLPCIDGKVRPVEPGTFPLAHGIANRVGLLRGYGNSLVAPQAQAFIESYLEVIGT